MTRGQPLAQIEPHVFEIDAGAMDENDRRRICGRSELDHMLAHAARFDETSTRRMRAADQP
jgi:hypothetical protein